jgi:hypothetical protein
MPSLYTKGGAIGNERGHKGEAQVKDFVWVARERAESGERGEGRRSGAAMHLLTIVVITNIILSF